MFTRFRYSWFMPPDSIWRPVGVIFVASFVILGMVLIMHWWKGVPVRNLTRDPAAITKSPFFIGFLSNVGILLWAAASAICLFSASLLKRLSDPGIYCHFLYASGLLTLLLALDDLFLLHEEVFPKYTGIPEMLVLAAYGTLALVYLLWFRMVIWKTEYLLLGIALGFFGLSLGVDAVDHLFVYPGNLGFFLEDGAKFVGIVAWLVYLTRVSALALTLERTAGKHPCN